MIIFLCEMQALEYYCNEVIYAGRFWHCLGNTLCLNCIAFIWNFFPRDTPHPHTMLLFCFFILLLFYCTQQKLGKPSGGQNDSCKSHSILSPSLTASDKFKSYCGGFFTNMPDNYSFRDKKVIFSVFSYLSHFHTSWAFPTQMTNETEPFIYHTLGKSYFLVKVDSGMIILFIFYFLHFSIINCM